MYCIYRSTNELGKSYTMCTILNVCKLTYYIIFSLLYLLNSIECMYVHMYMGSLNVHSLKFFVPKLLNLHTFMK